MPKKLTHRGRPRLLGALVSVLLVGTSVSAHALDDAQQARLRYYIDCYFLLLTDTERHVAECDPELPPGFTFSLEKTLTVGGNPPPPKPVTPTPTPPPPPPPPPVEEDDDGCPPNQLPDNCGGCYYPA